MGRNHGVLTNFANNGNGAYVASPDRLALNFDGSDDLVLSQNQVLLTQNTTVSLWMQYPGPGTGFRGAFDVGVLAVGSRLFIGWNSQNIYIDRFGGGINVSGFYDFLWHQVTAVIQNSIFFIYVDGLLRATSAQTWSPQLGNLRIGSSLDNARFPGLIDDVTIFNTALTPNEVRFLYEQGRGGGMLLEPPKRRAFFVPTLPLPVRRRSSRFLTFPG
jgi:hypothetical protein